MNSVVGGLRAIELPPFRDAHVARAPGHTLVGKKLELLQEVVREPSASDFSPPTTRGPRGRCRKRRRPRHPSTSNWSWRRFRAAITIAPSTLSWPSGLPLSFRREQYHVHAGPNADHQCRRKAQAARHI